MTTTPRKGFYAYADRNERILVWLAVLLFAAAAIDGLIVSIANFGRNVDFAQNIALMSIAFVMYVFALVMILVRRIDQRLNALEAPEA